jgi:hypothetical protein
MNDIFHPKDVAVFNPSGILLTLSTNSKPCGGNIEASLKHAFYRNGLKMVCHTWNPSCGAATC